MKKYVLLLLVAFTTTVLYGQDIDPKYLEGAVPLVDGKVVFEKAIKTQNKISGKELYGLMEKWAKEKYDRKDDKLKNRVLLTDPEKRHIACQGADELLFSKTIISYDATIMHYQLILVISDNECKTTIKNISFDYDYSNDGIVNVPAEEMISDKNTLYDNGKKIVRYYRKFRINAVDRIDDIFESIDVYLNGKQTKGAVSKASSGVDSDE
ncbi:MAG: DUF4468 domain-containing protein [Dysgonomonas sp.]